MRWRVVGEGLKAAYPHPNAPPPPPFPPPPTPFFYYDVAARESESRRRPNPHTPPTHFFMLLEIRALSSLSKAKWYFIQDYFPGYWERYTEYVFCFQSYQKMTKTHGIWNSVITFLNSHCQYETPDLNNGVIFSSFNSLLELCEKHKCMDMFLTIMRFIFPLDIAEHRWIITKKKHRLLLHALFADQSGTKKGSGKSGGKKKSGQGPIFLLDAKRFVNQCVSDIVEKDVDKESVSKCLQWLVEYGLTGEAKCLGVPGGGTGNDEATVLCNSQAKLQKHIEKYLAKQHKESERVEAYEDDKPEDGGDDMQKTPNRDDIKAPKDLGGIVLEGPAAESWLMLAKEVFPNDVKWVELFFKNNSYKSIEECNDKMTVTKTKLGRMHKSFAKAVIDINSNISNLMDSMLKLKLEAIGRDAVISAIVDFLSSIVFKVSSVQKSNPGPRARLTAPVCPSAPPSYPLFPLPSPPRRIKQTETRI